MIASVSAIEGVAQARDTFSNTRPTGYLTDGRPTAVVVQDGRGGTMGSWSAVGGGGGRAPAAWTCRYHPFVGGPSGFEVTVDFGSAPVLEVGQQYALACRDDAGALVYQQVVLWDPADPLAGLVAEERLADQALAALDLPLPTAEASPPLDRPQLVGLDTWLWVDHWRPVTATASLGGVTATVTAQPAGLRWDLGDGTSLRCEGPGTPWGATGGTPCRHVWQTRSTGQGGGAFTVTTSIDWDVTWSSSTGATGGLGSLTTSTATDVTVLEAQAVIGG